MWLIYESSEIDKIVGKLPIEILQQYEKWKDIVTISGIEGLRKIKGFRDEKLSDLWQEYRSSRLNYNYRVIYKAEKEYFIVKVIKITPHDYSK